MAMSLRTRSKWLIGALGCLLAGVALALAAVPPCGEWARSPPQILGVGRGLGELKVGAAVVPLEVPLPATVAGYGPPRHEATRAGLPLEARATALSVGGEALTLVELDTLLVTARMQLAVAEGFPGRVWLTATHAHTSVGGYDARLASEVAALGASSPALEALLVGAARQSVERARAAMVVGHLELGSVRVEGLNVARSGDAVDQRLTVLRFVGQRPIAQWVIFSAHPTLADPAAGVLDPDWPGRLAQLAAGDGGPVTLVLQGAGGNASVARDRAPTADDFARELRTAIDAAPLAAVEHPALAWAEVAFALPHPDGSRLTPAMLAPLAERALCAGAEHDALVSVLRLGSIGLLFTTLEPSAAAGLVLEEQSHTQRVVGLSNGYHGYLETEAAVSARTGESKRQYFGPELARIVSDAARLAGDLTVAK
jgi:hypothetical protein